MDKYNRPYKYHARGCEKLQGFTYSGGLLRHKREVYKLHRELRSLSSVLMVTASAAHAPNLRRKRI
ncbi:uncharacterized protein K441DRAFT_668063 [Cenococcum geophilum 1.58]|uniref:uncharacterized protein n=1 Tax=Cenococcum geophilum 1.58 TaxID=794803 RepID=UPI00358F0A90|nr:hypothetical protein K441DRAFT_668063 [Cenococcum geophilum 1.58]